MGVLTAGLCTRRRARRGPASVSCIMVDDPGCLFPQIRYTLLSTCEMVHPKESPTWGSRSIDATSH